MTNTMAKILLALLALTVLTGAASAQSQTLYDANGKVVGRSATDGRTTTLYDANGLELCEMADVGMAKVMLQLAMLGWGVLKGTTAPAVAFGLG